MKTSLTSISFRKKSISQITNLAHDAQLDAIEWGGDVHVKPGDKEAALFAYRSCHELGLGISAYGSYYEAGSNEPFMPVLDTALRLQCPLIRIWAGNVASNTCSIDERKRINERLSYAVSLAKKAGCILATEHHINTLSDTLDSTLQLLSDVPGLYTFWQPPIGNTPTENINELVRLKGHIQNVHVYQWNASYERFPLSDGIDTWKTYLSTIQEHNVPRYATIEFVKDNSEEQLMQDAATLRSIINEL